MPQPEVPTVSLKLWRDDAVVLFDWLMKTNLDTLPIEHPAEKQALMDLLTRLETDTNVPYGVSGDGLTQGEIDSARRGRVAPKSPRTPGSLRPVPGPRF